MTSLVTRTAMRSGGIRWPMRMMLICSDATLVDPLRRVLEGLSYRVEAIGGGHAALERVEIETFDLVVVGSALDDMAAADLVALLRRRHVVTPILAYGPMDVASRVRVLDAGADDCLASPVEDAELAARLRALVRRGAADQGAWLRGGEINMHLTTRTVQAHGQPLRLTPREFTLLECLLRNRDRLVGRAVLKERVWGAEEDANGSNVVEVYVSRLRRKLRAADSPACIRTVPGSGYILITDEGRQEA